jgi:hypothetical protein
MPQVVPGLAEVEAGASKAGEAALAKAQAAGETDQAKLKATAGRAAAGYRQKMVSEYTKMQEIGGLSGRFVMALVLAGAIAWGWKLRLFQLPGMILTPLVFWFFLRVPNITFFEIPLESVFLGTIPVTTMSLGMFFIGFFTVGQLSFWGNYLPHVYPVHLRGTGESFAANIGGRLIGTMAAALAAEVAKLMPYDTAPMQFAAAAAVVGGTVYLLGFANSFALPEPDPKTVAE